MKIEELIPLLKGLVEEKTSKNNGKKFYAITEEQMDMKGIDAKEVLELGFKKYENANYGTSYVLWGEIDKLGEVPEQKKVPWNGKDQKSIERQCALKTAVEFCTAQQIYKMDAVIGIASEFLDFIQKGGK